MAGDSIRSRPLPERISRRNPRRRAARQYLNRPPQFLRRMHRQPPIGRSQNDFPIRQFRRIDPKTPKTAAESETTRPEYAPSRTPELSRQIHHNGILQALPVPPP